MKKTKHRRRLVCGKKRCGGMALLSVLFIVFAVAAVAMGILWRSDMALACGQNLALRNQSDYLAWAGLEYARAVIQSYGSTPLQGPFPSTPLTLGTDGNCEVEILSAAETEPRVYTYTVTSRGWYGSACDPRAYSGLQAGIRYWADDANGKAVFLFIGRQ